VDQNFLNARYLQVCARTGSFFLFCSKFFFALGYPSFARAFRIARTAEAAVLGKPRRGRAESPSRPVLLAARCGAALTNALRCRRTVSVCAVLRRAKRGRFAYFALKLALIEICPERGLPIARTYFKYIAQVTEPQVLVDATWNAHTDRMA